MKLLMLCDKMFWERKMSRVRFHAMDAIARHPEVEAVKDGPNFDGWVDVPTSVKKHKPDLVFWYKPLEMKGYENVGVPTVISYNELWEIDWSTAEITKSNSNLVVCHHKNDMKNYDHLKDKHIFVNNPHCIEKTIFKDYGLKKEYDVLFVGVVSDSIYPLRGRLYKVIQKIPNHKILKHPGYRIDDIDAQVVHYAKELNKAKIVVTCASKYMYALAKYSEVPACKSFLIADIPDERQQFFRSFMGEVHNNYSEQQIINVINYWISHDKEREEKTKLGYDLTHKDYTQEHYAQRFVEAVNDKLGIK